MELHNGITMLFFGVQFSSIFENGEHEALNVKHWTAALFM